MELRDLIVTPIVIILVYVVAYFVRPYCTDHITRKYFMPGLTVRIIGALAVGFIYQFYYNGGDTFNFHTHGSRHIWEAFMDDPVKGMRLLVRDEDQTGLYSYTSKMIFSHDPSSYAIIQIAAIFDLFTFSSYSATAVLFAAVAFVGMWLFFLTFYRQFPSLHQWLAAAAFFIPSVFFWGSGILKDTITLSCLGAATYLVYQIGIERRAKTWLVLLLLTCLFIIYHVKIYILLMFLPAAIVWVFMANLYTIKNTMLRIILLPVVTGLSLLLGFMAISKAGEDNPRYSLSAISKTAQITAYDIRYWTGRDAGSGYTLGELDGTWQSMLRLAPDAINVSLFRPYLWEVSNPLMFLSSVESFSLLLVTLGVIVVCRRYVFKSMLYPPILFCLMFAIGFAFSVGVSTFNFGTLMRYKIPLLPFYCTALIAIIHYRNSSRKLERLELTE